MAISVSESWKKGHGPENSEKFENHQPSSFSEKCFNVILISIHLKQQQQQQQQLGYLFCSS